MVVVGICAGISLIRKMKMTPEMKLLRAFIDACGFDVDVVNAEEPCGRGELDFKVTKRKKQVKPRKVSNVSYSPEFMEFWAHYPSRGVHNNPKPLAFKKWQAVLKSANHLNDITAHDLIMSAKRYKKQCDALEKTGTEFVLQASTFLGPSRHYLEEWALPEPKKEKLVVPFGDAMEPWAKQHGFRGPGRRESYDEYHKFLKIEAEKVNNQN